MIKFEIHRWQVWWIGLSWLAAFVGLAFNLALLSVGLGTLGMQLLIVFLWDRR